MATDTLTIAGTFTYDEAPGGPEVSGILGSPVITPTSTTGPTLDYNESIGNVAVLAPAAIYIINFGSLAEADWLYIGTDQPVTVKLNGSVDTISLIAGGFIAIYKGSITAATITCGPVGAKVKYLLLGD
jgi:hypothetical protein